ncbi:hypothetical protein SeseC_00501 [Streptococcus equi subsp. zooepidemicus ATCC 35246]|nr:hypothetical protein SeseC_00501 [Streptococcus equi subsp. zooepidemicus ATCC 35246]
MIGKIKKALISSDKLFLLKPNDYYRFYERYIHRNILSFYFQ